MDRPPPDLPEAHLTHLKGSEARLWALIEERSRPGADTAAIDQRIWDIFGEEWAVMFTDLAGFSRNVAAFGITHFLQIIFEQNRLLRPVIAHHDGLLIKSEADSLLAIFRRPSQALACAVAMQHACEAWNVGRAPEDRILLCVGLGFGRMLRIGDNDVWGQEVNAASKLGEDTAKAREVLVTAALREAVGEVPGIRFAPIEVTVAGTTGCFRAEYAG